ncbi:MAG: hypothetical protein JNK85_15635 [Verrucomicrobiales bacterium]|nr:hypothetical protein [Verrucomicrobiales bacterium]
MAALMGIHLGVRAVGPPLDLSGEWEAIPSLFVPHGGPYHRLSFRLLSVELLPETIPGLRSYEVRHSGQLTFYETRRFWRSPAGCDLAAEVGPGAYEPYSRTYSLGYGLNVTSYWTIQTSAGTDSGSIRVGSIEGVGTFNLPKVPSPHAQFFTRMFYGFSPGAGLSPVGDAHARLKLFGTSAGGGEVVESDRCSNTPFGTGADHGQLTFWRVSSAPSELAPTGKIRGRLKSAETVLTDGSGDEINRASVHLFRQSRWLRGKDPEESDAQYRAYLEGERTLAAPAAVLTPDSQGHFAFEGLPLFARSGGSVQGWVPQGYLVVVASAETDEMAMDSESNLIPGRTNTVTFQGAQRINVLADTELEIELRPIASLHAKRELVAQISRLGPTQYAPIEARADAHLDRLATRGTLTEAEDEGVRRALWAERVIRDGARYADTVLDLGLTGLGTLLADAIGDLKRWEGAGVADARAKFQKARDSDGPGRTAGFNLDSVGDFTPAMRTLLERGRSIELADELIKLVKALRPALQEALVSGGVAADEAKRIAVAFEQAMLAIMNLARNETLRGESKDYIKLQIKEHILKDLKPVLYDSPVSYSFTALTAPSLQVSVDRMIQWDRSDPVSYVRDRDRTVEVLTQLGNAASGVIAGAILFQGGAEAADLTQKYAGLAGVVPPARAYAAAVEQFAKLAKYVANGAGIVGPAIYAFAGGPKLIREGVYAAYGATPPTGGTLGQSRFESRSRFSSLAGSSPTRLVVPPIQDILTAQGSLDGWVRSNHVGSAIQAAAGLSGTGYGAVWETWQESCDRVELELRAYEVPATPGDYSILVPHAAYFRTKSEILVAKSAYDDALLEWFLSVLSGAYTNAADPRSQAAVFQILELGRVLRAVLTDSQESLRLMFNTVKSSRTPRPAIRIGRPKSGGLGPDVTEIQNSPQRITIETFVENLGGTQLDGVAVALRLPPEQTTLRVAGESIRTVAFPSATASGMSPGVTVSWDVEYVGQFQEASVEFDLELLERGEPPESFESNVVHGKLRIAPERRDVDLDGLPDAFENSLGLAASRPDADEDSDSDGVSNRDEFHLGTRPDRADTDGDGLGDGEETRPGADGVLSSPLVVDSDGDGVGDLRDGAPLDPSTAAWGGGLGLVAWSLDTQRVTVTRETPTALVQVENPGPGVFRWLAEADDPSLAWVSPGFGSGGTKAPLIFSLPPGFRWPRTGSYSTRVRVRNVADPHADYREIQVVVMSDFGSPVRAVLSADRGVVQLEWRGVVGKQYTVESSEDLRAWNRSEVVPISLGSGWVRWSEVRGEASLGGAGFARFYRVQARDPGP